MCNLMVNLMVIIVVTLIPVEGHRNGIDVDGACSDLKPQHGPPPQTSSPPYKITFEGSTYYPNKPVFINLLACSEPFKGFMIQARKAGADTNELLGNFTATESNAACSGRALVHSIASAKTTVNINWNPPSPPAGHVVFRVTYVKDKDTFWTNIISDTLYDASASNTNETLFNKTDVASKCSGVTGASVVTTAKASIYSSDIQPDFSCGKTKGCFSKRTSNGYAFSVSWSSSVDNATFVLSSPILYSEGFYIALAFSSDKKMGDDSVMGCMMNASGSVFLFLGYNTERVHPTFFNDSDIQLINYSTKDGILTCTIERPVSAKEKRFNIVQRWTLLFVQGKTTTNGQLDISYHETNFYISRKQVSAFSVVNLEVDSLENPMIKAHGCLMVGAWIFLASIGIIVARYYKPVWEITMCSEKVWFQIHRVCMILVFCATAAGFIIIFVEVTEWSDIDFEDRQFLVGHPIIGVIVMALTIINPLMALFRPHPNTPGRPIFNWAHWFVGTAAHILAVIGVFFGVLIPDSQVPYYTVYILGAYVAWQLFVEIILALISCIGKRRDRSETYELNGGGEATKTSVQTESNLTSVVKLVILVVHVLVVGALSAAVIAIIAVGKSELEE